jgi:uncharacterized protein (DUF885 family)
VGSQKRDILSCLLVLSLSITLGCGKKSGQGVAPGPKGTSAQAANVDVEKPVSEIQAQAETMNVESLRATALKYKEAIVAKQGDLEKLAAKIKETPIAEALGQEAKTLKTEFQNIDTSLKALKDRFQVYYDTLKKKGGDLSNLAL